MDAFKNFSKSTLAAGITSGAISLTVATGQGARFPAAPFNAVIWNRTDFADPSDDPNVEIVRVTVVAGDVFTITRAQESTAASAHNTGGKTYGIIATLTAKTLVGLLANGIESNPVSNVPILKGTLAVGSLLGFQFLQNQDPLVGPWEVTISSAVNPGPTTRRDTYWQIGYNPRGLADLMRFYNAIETFWNPGGTQTQIETYYEYIDPNNGGGAVGNVRPFGITLRRDVKDIQTDFFTSRVNFFDWPGHVGADHGFFSLQYPNASINDGNLLIAGSNALDEQRGVQIAGYFAVCMNYPNKRYYFGDNSQTIVPLGSFWGPFNFGTPNIEPVDSTTWPYELSIGFRGSAITDLVLLQRSNASMARWFYFQSLDGSNQGDLSYDGHLRWGSGVGGAGPDIGLKRSAAATYRITDGGGGFGNLEVGTLYLNDGSVKQVVYGAPGSGGTGLKVLAIAN
jgi:hypothetical protein